MTAIKNHNKKNSYSKLTLIILLFLSCSKNPIEKGKESDALKIEYAFTRSIGQNTAEVVWKCSSKSYGVITYGRTWLENPQFVFFKSDIQYYKLTGLSSGTFYNYQVGCLNERKAVYFIQKFQTLPTPPTYVAFPPVSNPAPSFPSPPYFYNVPAVSQAAIDRGIWLVGGIGFSNTPIAQIDVYDPVTDTWYSAITNVPTARSYSGVTSLNGKIYVIGGMTAGFSVSSLVEEYTPSTNTWKTLAAAPVSIQGALAVASGNSIYLIGGSVTTSAAAAIPNVVYRFTPDTSTGSWTTITSVSAIPARMDLSGCSMYGTLFFNSGRDTTGVAQLTSDAYIPASNSTTSIGEGNFSLP